MYEGVKITGKRPLHLQPAAVGTVVYVCARCYSVMTRQEALGICFLGLISTCRQYYKPFANVQNFSLMNYFGTAILIAMPSSPKTGYFGPSGAPGFGCTTVQGKQEKRRR